MGSISKEMRQAIRDTYAIYMPRLKAGERIDPYSIYPYDWPRYMSPIEQVYWGRLRARGENYYPQVPCGPYFIDFASPVRGVAVELDGKQWHLDKEKDARRQEYIETHGYPTVIRLTGSHVYELEPLPGMENYERDRAEDRRLIEDRPYRPIGRMSSLESIMTEKLDEIIKKGVDT